jgi:hypothetical protein
MFIASLVPMFIASLVPMFSANVYCKFIGMASVRRKRRRCRIFVPCCFDMGVMQICFPSHFREAPASFSNSISRGYPRGGKASTIGSGRAWTPTTACAAGENSTKFLEQIF